MVGAGVDLFDLREQALVGDRPGRAAAASALVIGRRPQGAADRLDPEAVVMFVDEHAYLGRCGSSSVAKKTEAALRISLARPQLLDLVLQGLQSFSLIAGEQVGPPALVGFGLADPAAQRLALDPEVLGNLGDRAIGFKRETDASLPQLLGVLPRCWHSRRFSSPEDGTSSFRSPRERRDGSAPAHPMGGCEGVGEDCLTPDDA